MTFLTKYKFDSFTEYNNIALPSDTPSLTVVKEAYDYIYNFYINFVQFYVNSVDMTSVHNSLSDANSTMIRENKEAVMEMMLNVINLLNFYEPP